MVRGMLRAMDEGSATLKLNLGCGHSCPPGWMNIDSSFGATLAQHPSLRRFLHAVLPARLLPASNWPSNVRRMDLTRGIQLEDGTVDAVYTSHFLEHLPRERALELLRGPPRAPQRRRAEGDRA